MTFDLGGSLALALRGVVSMLTVPTLVALFVAAASAVFELGLSIGERARGLRTLAASTYVAAQRVASRRIDRADLLARVGPMLGLMGTLAPLGPGLAALGRGDAATLAASMTTAFDTTALGLLVGIVGFSVGRLRRRWYEHLLAALEEAEHAA